jgi:hypothetical protein
MKPLLLIAGLALVAAGLLFAGQGSGFVPWPERSFMVQQTQWIYYGGAIALAGIVLIVFARR